MRRDVAGRAGECTCGRMLHLGYGAFVWQDAAFMLWGDRVPGCCMQGRGAHKWQDAACMAGEHTSGRMLHLAACMAGKHTSGRMLQAGQWSMRVASVVGCCMHGKEAYEWRDAACRAEERACGRTQAGEEAK